MASGPPVGDQGLAVPGNYHVGLLQGSTTVARVHPRDSGLGLVFPCSVPVESSCSLRSVIAALVVAVAILGLGSAFLSSSLRTLAQETCSSCLCQVNSFALAHRRVNLFRVGSSLFLTVNSWPVIQGVCGCEVNAGHPHSLQTFGVGPYTAHTTVIVLLRSVWGEGARSYFPSRASR